jgi:hypothetical protein
VAPSRWLVFSKEGRYIGSTMQKHCELLQVSHANEKAHRLSFSRANRAKLSKQ